MAGIRQLVRKHIPLRTRIAVGRFLLGSWTTTKMMAAVLKDLIFPPPVCSEIVFGDPANAKRRVAVFCHFDPNGHASTNVIHYLQSLRKTGLDVVVVSASPTLTDDAINAMSAHAACIIRRTNVGYDFGCYQEGIRRLGDYSSLDLLILANDSVLGPFSDLTKMLTRFDASADVWGLTDSTEFTPHLQSYLLAFRKPALNSPAFRSFWRDYKALGSKDWAIRAGELGLSRTLYRGKLRLKALFPTKKLYEEFLRNADENDEQLRAFVGAGIPLNATHCFATQLIRDHGFPFVKRELVERNPMRLKSALLLQDVVEARFGASSLRWLRDSGATLAQPSAGTAHSRISTAPRQGVPVDRDQ